MSTCPSCPLSQTPYEDQLRQKRDKLVVALRAYSRFESVEIRGPEAAPEVHGYRNRARMVVRTEATSPADILGFYEEGSRTVVPVEHCQAHHPSVEAVLQELRPLLFRYGALRHFARFVDVRSTAGHAADKESAIVTLAGPLPEQKDAAQSEAARQTKLNELEGSATALRHDLEQNLKDLPEALEIAVHLNVDQQHSQAVLSGEQRVVAGDAALAYRLSGREFHVRPTTFFQVNLDQLEVAHGRMADALPDDPERLVDLYCGVGAHGIALAGPDSELFGADIVELAVDLARENARRADINAEFLAASDTQATDWLLERLDARPFHLITNPARAGMSPQTIAFIAKSRPETVLYLSCEPKTLARDLDRLGEQGFRVRSIEGFDFMPQTDQIETLAILDSAPLDSAPLDSAPLDSASDDAPTPSRERAFQPQDFSNRRFSIGVSGPNRLPETLEHVARSVWVALVAGETIKHGFLPHARDVDDQARIEINRLRKFEGNSVLRIEATTLDDTEIRQRLRAWNHPVLGDEDFGDRNANHLAEKHAFLDRIALHCVSVEAGGETWRAEVPGQFLGLMRLPRKVLEGRG